MVHYVFTPWRNKEELLLVRRQFYPHHRHSNNNTTTSTSLLSSSSLITTNAPSSSSNLLISSSSAAKGEEADQLQRNTTTITVLKDDEEEEKRHQDEMRKRRRGLEDIEKQKAVSRVSMWMHRGNCPHIVESTALLTAAILSDDDFTGGIGGGNSIMGGSSYSVRAAYSAAFSRFVTGLLDSHQEKLRKQSMYDVAKSVGLPATFVELRHQATHETLPSLSRLRVAAKKGLEWMWGYYWVGIGPLSLDLEEVAVEKMYGGREDVKKSKQERCRELLVRYLNEEDERRRRVFRAGLKVFEKEDKGMVLRGVDVVCNNGGIINGKGMRRAVGLVRELDGEGEELRVDERMDDVEEEEGAKEKEVGVEDVEMVREELGRVLEGAKGKEEKERPSWVLVDGGEWVPKPIGLIFTRKMHVRSIPMWTGSHDNYAYLVVDDKSKDAVIIDPAHPAEVLPVLKKAIDDKEINLTAIVNTHHHWDHAGGNEELLAGLGTPSLPIIGGKDCKKVTKTPTHNEEFKIGDINVKALHTPCHTQDSICFYMQDGDDRVVFTGDTLFIGGCGRFFEGTGEEMHKALNVTLASLHDDTRVFPGHEYTKSNAKFGASVLQSHDVLSLQSFAEDCKETQGRFTIGDEKKHNVFMRPQDPEIQKATGETDPVAIMNKLREMKNNFKRSKLARDNQITAVEESEIREAFSLFSEPSPRNPNLQLLPIPDVRRALIALGIPASSPVELAEFTSILDPEELGFCELEPFLAICAIKFRTGVPSDHEQEVNEAYALFTGRADADCIRLEHLRKVARLLRMDEREVTDEMLRDMILEANGGAGVNRGVRKDEFDGVLRRAGVWR
ncbi:beta-lactamase-like protein [Cladorrhinum sp. PSN259]|nr:beta-lactamase-like protein [Cladorrhinum sp. PSN259]